MVNCIDMIPDTSLQASLYRRAH